MQSTDVVPESCVRILEWDPNLYSVQGVHQVASLRSPPSMNLVAHRPDTPVLVLPPRSRYVPHRAEVQGAWQPGNDDDVSLPSGEPRSRPEQNGIDPAGDLVAQTYKIPPRLNAPTRAQTPGVRVQQSRPPPPDGSLVRVQPGPRPISARTRPSGTSSLFSPDVKPFRKEAVPRPGSAPDKNDGRLRSEIYALRSPGEETLAAPGLSPRTPTGRAPNDQLQFELSVTASVLRAAQTRLAQEREQRAIARIGEERAVESMKLARDETKKLHEQKVLEEVKLAQAMAAQRKELEEDLDRLERDREVSPAQDITLACFIRPSPPLLVGRDQTHEPAVCAI